MGAIALLASHRAQVVVLRTSTARQRPQKRRPVMAGVRGSRIGKRYGVFLLRSSSSSSSSSSASLVDWDEVVDREAAALPESVLAESAVSLASSASFAISAASAARSAALRAVAAALSAETSAFPSMSSAASRAATAEASASFAACSAFSALVCDCGPAKAWGSARAAAMAVARISVRLRMVWLL